MFDILDTGETDETFVISFRADPFVLSYVRIPFLHGTTIAEALAEIGVTPEIGSVFIEGVFIEPGDWAAVRPNAGVQVDLRGQPGVSGLIALVSAIAGAWASSVVAGSAFAIALGKFGTIIANVVGAVVSFAITTIASSLFTPAIGDDPATARTPDTATRFGIRGGSNRSRPYGAVPVVMGTHRMFPDHAGSQYTEIVGNDQYLRILVCWGMAGFGINLASLKIGNTLLTDFSDVEQEHDLVGASPLPMKLYPTTASKTDLSIILEDTTWVTRTTEIDCTEIGITFTFPRGLYRLQSSGVRSIATVSVSVEIRPAGTGLPWMSWISNQSIGRDENSAVRVSYRIQNLPENAWDVRVYRSTASTDDEVQDELAWTALRGFRSENPINLIGVAKSAFRIRATDQLNGVVDQISAVVSRTVETWNGSNWLTPNYSSNPAALFRDVLIGQGNARPVARARLDDGPTGSLTTWWTFCAAYGLTYNKILDGRASVMERLTEIAAAGFATPTMIDDKWGVVIDSARSTVVQHFTPRNTTSFRGEIPYGEIPHGLRVQYISAEDDYRADERVVYDDGYSAGNATDFEVIRAEGATNASVAYAVGRHVLATGRLRPEQWIVGTDFEHMACTRGDLVRFSHDVPLIGQIAARIVAISGYDITLDDYVTIEAFPISHSIRVRKADGTTATYLVIMPIAGSYKTITTEPFTGLAVGDLVMFGRSTIETVEALVAGITPGDDLTAELRLIPYNADVYNAWTSIPAYSAQISQPVALSQTGPVTPLIASILSDESAIPKGMEGQATPVMLIALEPGFAGPNSAFSTEPYEYTIRWARANGAGHEFSYTLSTGILTLDGDEFADFELEGDHSGDLDLEGDMDAATGTAVWNEGGWSYTRVPADTAETVIANLITHEPYKVQAMATDAYAGVSGWSAITYHTVVGFGAKPADLTTFGITALLDHTYVEWTYVGIPGDCVGYEIRYHPDEDVTDWARMVTLSDEVPRTARSYTVPSRAGSYAIKAIDVIGQRSVNALYINSTLVDPAAMNVVSAATEDPTFAGTKTDTTVVSNQLVLTQTGGVFTPLTGTYEWGAVDLSEVYTSRVRVDVDADNYNLRSVMSEWATLAEVGTLAGDTTGDEYSIEPQIAISTVDSPTPSYGAWRRFAAGDYTARHIKFRLVLTTTDQYVSPAIDNLATSIDMPDRVARGENITTTAATYSVAFSPYFRATPSITIAAQNMGTGDYYTIANQARTGFDVTFYNSAAAAQVRTFDWQAVGYGRERGT